MSKIITISRQFGSGGRELGRRIAQELGWAYYDNEVVSEIAKSTSYSEEYVHSLLEHRPTTLYPIHYGNTFLSLTDGSYENTMDVYSAQYKIIKEMAGNGNCVIIGRCADQILKDMKPFRIFVYASLESRVKRCKDREEKATEGEKKIARKIKTIDKHRAKYYQFYTGEKWGNPLNFDMMVNTTDQDVEHIAKTIAHMLLE